MRKTEKDQKHNDWLECLQKRMHSSISSLSKHSNIVSAFLRTLGIVKPFYIYNNL